LIDIIVTYSIELTLDLRVSNLRLCEHCKDSLQKVLLGSPVCRFESLLLH